MEKVSLISHFYQEKIRKLIFLFFAIDSILLPFLVSCTVRPPFTQDQYQLVQAGTQVVILEKQFGAPYDIKDLGNGVFEYRYIERIDVGSQGTEHIHYIFTVSNGRIVAKQYQKIGGIDYFKTP